MRLPTLSLAVMLAVLAPAAAQYPDWRHSGPLVLLTTPDGADLPPTCRETDFPVLVRLSRDTFDFRQARPDGADVRFSMDGQPLAYQLEQWDPAAGAACFWVRVPEIRGNRRQVLTLHWGRPDAASESSGRAVFNESNGFAAVLHLAGAGGALADEAGTLSPANAGTTDSPGVIGRGRHFEPGQGIACGEKLTGLPAGRSPHTTEAWVRAGEVNGTVVGWGNEQAQGKVVMQVASPPRIRMDCWFSGADVASAGRLPMKEWVHVVHACRPGESRLYLNGRPAGVSARTDSPLDIRTPARLWLGGWYGHYRFQGDLDEVRLSRVARSADWVKLCYENQKPLQTLVGTLPPPGQDFAVSPAAATVDEGGRATFTARAGGADKVSWILQRDGEEKVVAVDRLTWTFDAGRVTRDTPCTLRFKAVYPHGVKTLDVPVTVKEAIPEPQCSLAAPPAWDGRQRIEVVPVIGNREALRARGAGELHYRWSVASGAVIQEVLPDRLVLKRSQYTGPLTVSIAVDNGGAATTASARIQVTEPASDPWLTRPPGPDEKPQEGQFYARDDKNEGTLHCNGRLEGPAEAVTLKVFADDKPFAAVTRKPGPDGRYAFAVKLKPGLVRYRVELGTRADGRDTVLHRAGNLLCGDAFLIDGQSNALATDTPEKSPPEPSEWVRSYGTPPGRGSPGGNLWCSPVWKAGRGETAEIGWWGMELARRLVDSQKVPIFILNGAVGGTRIDQHLPSPVDRADPATLYGRTLRRLQGAKLTHGVRAVIWHQGENDQGADGPGGGYGWETYQQHFVTLAAAWKEDFPNLQHYYVFQIWPNACSMGNGQGDRLREVQRTLPRLFSRLDVLSTVGVRPGGPCHYPLAGWAEFARMLQPLIERDHYGRIPAGPLTPPNLRRAAWTSPARDAIALEFDQPVVWTENLAGQFYPDGERDRVASGAVAGNVLTLRLKAPSTARTITYLKEMSWSPDRLLRGANGLAALTFCEMPILPP